MSVDEYSVAALVVMANAALPLRVRGALSAVVLLSEVAAPVVLTVMVVAAVLTSKVAAVPDRVNGLVFAVLFT